MSTELTLPPLGGKAEEADVIGWLVAEGDHVNEGQPVLEVSFEKVNVEVVAPVSGTLTRIAVAAGDLVTVDQLLAVIS